MPHLTQTHATLDIAFRHGFNEYHLAESLQVDGPKEFSQYTEQLLSLDWSLDDERLTPPAEKPTRHYRVYCYVPKTDKYSNPEAKVVPRVTFMSNARARERRRTIQAVSPHQVTINSRISKPRRLDLLNMNLMRRVTSSTSPKRWAASSSRWWRNLNIPFTSQLWRLRIALSPTGSIPDTVCLLLRWSTIRNDKSTYTIFKARLTTHSARNV
jgi:hypothetical protein